MVPPHFCVAWRHIALRWVGQQYCSYSRGSSFVILIHHRPFTCFLPRRLFFIPFTPHPFNNDYLSSTCSFPSNDEFHVLASTSSPMYDHQTFLLDFPTLLFPFFLFFFTSQWQWSSLVSISGSSGSSHFNLVPVSAFFFLVRLIFDVIVTRSHCIVHHYYY